MNDVSISPVHQPSKVIKSQLVLEQMRKAAVAELTTDMSQTLEYSLADWFSLISLLLGMTGMLLRSKIAAFGACFVFLAHVAHLRTADTDYKHLASTGLFTLMSLMTSFLRTSTNATAGLSPLTAIQNLFAG